MVGEREQERCMEPFLGRRVNGQMGNAWPSSCEYHNAITEHVHEVLVTVVAFCEEMAFVCTCGLVV